MEPLQNEEKAATRDELSELTLPALPAGHESLKSTDSIIPFCADLLRCETKMADVGDSAVGTVRYIKQVHTAYFENDSRLKDIGLYQLGILKRLEELGTRHVFVEGLYTDLNCADSAAERVFSKYTHGLLNRKKWQDFPADGFLDTLRKQFSDSSYLSAPTEEQRFLLGAVGAAFIYAALHVDIELHRTISQKKDAKLFIRQMSHEPESVRFGWYRTTAREYFAAKEVCSFLDKNPGADVAIVFGAAHCFEPMLKRVWAVEPLLEINSFPDLHKKVMPSQ